ncbi:MAG: glycoside hydrolase family 38 C-terminal domain-containing protein [Phycisphaerales bacterium]
MKHLLPLLAGLALSINAVAHAEEQPASPGPAATTKRTAEPTPDLTKQPTLYVVGYAHLDTQWRWTYQDSIREYLPKTLHDNFKLFEKYPSYVFNFSGSRRYQMIKEYYPADYETMKKYIAAGRWFPCGSSVDENDANVPSLESYVRHILYGNKYFRNEFGVASDEYMLPDCFGFPASLPTMLNHCGVKGFSTQKLTWNAVVPIPFKVGVWDGPDGSSVMAALDPGSYSAEVRENLANSDSWAKRIDNNAAKSGVKVDYHYYGTGDTGGSPTERSVKAVEEAVHTSGKVKVISSAADEIFKALTPDLQKNLPHYKGELMLTEHSSGAVTSQAYMKRWNRKNERLADAAEKASLGAWWLGGRPYPGQKLEDAWYLVLGSQMHDILPGTSLPKAYDLAWNDEVLAGNQFGEVLTDASSSVISALDTRGDGATLVVYNPLSFAREDVVEASVPATGSPKSVKVTGPDGKAVAAQVLSVENGVAKIAFVAKSPSVSYSAYSVEFTDAAPASTLKVSDHELENETYVVKLDANGDVSSIFDKAAKKELLSAPIRLALHHENPRNWPAWNQDWADRQLAPKAFAGNPTSFKVVENGPARVAVEVTRTAEGSTFVQRIRLASGAAGQRVEFDTDVDWRSRQRSLRVHFPLTVSNPTATYDLAAGAIERGNGREKQYEYSFHEWFDLTDVSHEYGVTAMCDSKYGTDKPDDNTIRLTLLHTPGTRGGYPDQGTQDLGRHHVLFALYGHQGDWRQAAGPAQARGSTSRWSPSTLPSTKAPRAWARATRSCRSTSPA